MYHRVTIYSLIHPAVTHLSIAYTGGPTELPLRRKAVLNLVVQVDLDLSGDTRIV
eukprot:SAG31_NODE_761_length_12276_cov_4.530673_1_plen_55_part_00